MLYPMLGMPQGAEWFVILLIVIVVFGAAKLPELARSTGQALKIFKNETKGLIDDDKTSSASSPSSSSPPPVVTQELPPAPASPSAPGAAGPDPTTQAMPAMPAQPAPVEPTTEHRTS